MEVFLWMLPIKWFREVLLIMTSVAMVADALDPLNFGELL